MVLEDTEQELIEEEEQDIEHMNKQRLNYEIQIPQLALEMKEIS